MSLRRDWPLIVGIAVLAVLIGALLQQSFHYTGGRLVYALDDAYIHMAMAKNFSQHGVWGVTRHEFTSSSSSPLWTLLLSAIYAAVGPRELAPFALNIGCALALLVLAHVVLARLNVRPASEFVALLWIVLATPLMPLIFGGMEHVLQITVDLAFVFTAAATLSNEEMRWDRWAKWSALLAAAATSVRYEGMFLVAVVVLLLLARRRWSQAAAVLGLGLLPIIASGIVSLAQGWYFLPNSVLTKGRDAGIRGVVRAALGATGDAPDLALAWALLRQQVREAAHLVWLALGAVLVIVGRARAGKRFWAPRSLMLVIATAGAAVHLIASRANWFYRYEAYAVALVGVALVVMIDSMLRDRRQFRSSVLVLACAALVVGVGLSAMRGWRALEQTPVATRNVFEQQYQMAQLARRSFEGLTLAINDIGAITYYADVRVLDLYSLASRDVADLWLDDRLSTDAIRELASAHGVDIAIVYTDRYASFGGLPAEWRLLAEWGIEDNVVNGGDIVSFYAVAPGSDALLVDALRRYSPFLPPTVAQAGAHLD